MAHHLGSPVDLNGDGRAGRGGTPTPPRFLAVPTEISSVRERVRRMQGMSQRDLAQGIEAMEAVAAAAYRTSSVKTTGFMESPGDGSRRRNSRGRIEGSSRDQGTLERGNVDRGVTKVFTENSRKWSSFPSRPSTPGRTHASPRPVLRLPSGDTVQVPRANFSSSRPKFPDMYVAKATDLSSSSSSNASRDEALDTFPKSGSVRAAAQALGAAQVPGALSRGSPQRNFRSISSRGSPSAMSLTDDGFGSTDRHSGTLRRNGHGWWTRAERETQPIATSWRSEDANFMTDVVGERTESRRHEEAAREAEGKVASARHEAEDATKHVKLQAMNSTSDFGVDLRERRSSEADVTAAYQGILQEIDRERASLQQKLSAALRENDMLRAQVLRFKPSSPVSNGRTNGGHDATKEEEGEEDQPAQARQRSFMRPRARGYSSGKLDDEAPGGAASRRASGNGSASTSGSNDCSPGTLGGGRNGERLKDELLEKVLGQRVRMVQLMGLDSLIGDGSSNRGRHPSMAPEKSERRVDEASTRWTWMSNPQKITAKPSRGFGHDVPWGKEWARWYGRVSLTVTPGAETPSELSDSPEHYALLTDAAFYLMETRGGRPGCDSLCRLERHRIESISLPLETKTLPNGDEVAIRGKSLVLRLIFEEYLSVQTKDGLASMVMRHSGNFDEEEDEEDEVDDEDDSPSTPVGRGGQRDKGHLWLSCNDNEARGELIERICRWHRSKPRRMRSPRSKVGLGGGSTGSSESSPGTTDSGSDTVESPRARVTLHGHGAPGELEDEDTLEVEQVLMKELLAELADEKSLDVTALLMTAEGVPNRGTPT